MNKKRNGLEQNPAPTGMGIDVDGSLETGMSCPKAGKSVAVGSWLDVYADGVESSWRRSH